MQQRRRRRRALNQPGTPPPPPPADQASKMAAPATSRPAHWDARRARLGGGVGWAAVGGRPGRPDGPAGRAAPAGPGPWGDAAAREPA